MFKTTLAAAMLVSATNAACVFESVKVADFDELDSCTTASTTAKTPTWMTTSTYSEAAFTSGECAVYGTAAAAGAEGRFYKVTCTEATGFNVEFFKSTDVAVADACTVALTDSTTNPDEVYVWDTCYSSKAGTSAFSVKFSYVAAVEEAAAVEKSAKSLGFAMSALALAAIQML